MCARVWMTGGMRECTGWGCRRNGYRRMCACVHGVEECVCVVTGVGGVCADVCMHVCVVGTTGRRIGPPFGEENRSPGQRALGQVLPGTLMAPLGAPSATV